MYLAKIVNGNAPIVTEVCNDSWDCQQHGTNVKIVKVPREPWARRIKGGAAALSQTAAGAVASARVVLETQWLSPKAGGIGRLVTRG